ncbi:MAG TPA: hypothetical protein VGR96_12475 [Acidobacteriaceae bacterium]|nr:hypothetical protein [Acidobacteriaceae bacterium]
MMVSSRARRQFIAGLRAVADCYEHHPELYYDGLTACLTVYVAGPRSREILAAAVQALGKCERSGGHNEVVIARRFGEKVKLELFAPRADVCAPSVIGVRVEPALVIPASGELRIPEKTVEIVEWICPPFLQAIS